MIKGCFAILLAAGLTTACSDDNNNTNNTPEEETPSYTWTQNGGLRACDHLLFAADGSEDADGRQIGNGDQEFVFTGRQTLKAGTYTLKGWVYIADGAELTLSPGTVIKGDKQTKAALIAERGGKLIARGTQQAPIVFTSAQAKGNRKPGDWGGVILCGRARNNQTEMQIEGGPRTKHGGQDDADCSGALTYVRIEFAGYPFQKDKEINGLTLGSVGSGTEVDHVQVSYSNDDSFEWFGGTVNCRHLVAYRGWDDDFDTDNGFSGRVQFALGVRDPRIADTSQSNGFESDNCADGADVMPYTACTFANVTLVGPGLDPTFQNTPEYINGGTENPQNGSALGRFQSAMQIRRGSRLSCLNSIALGYPIGLMLDGEKGDTQASAGKGLLRVQNVWMAGMGQTGSDANKLYEDILVKDWAAKTYDRTQTSFSSQWLLKQTGCRVEADWKAWGLNERWTPSAASPLLRAATWAQSEPFFQKVAYIGALSPADNWLTGWTQFDPQNAEY